jgi:aminomethyltransferase
MTAAPAEPLRHTPLYEAQIALGGRMVPFAGYEMPVQYPSGIIKEHLHTRAAATLFDVSHMGQITLRSHSGGFAEAALALETLVPADILGLADGRQRYTLFTDPTGGIIDDLMVMRLGDELHLVVNAARKQADEAHLRAHVSSACAIEAHGNRALLALQGPRAEAALADLAPVVSTMRFMDVRTLELLGEVCTISRSGYTGEDGFEIGITAGSARKLWDLLLAAGSVLPAGLGARDSLRLEAGLCLYGSDLDSSTSPVEAALEWSIGRQRRAGGSRSGGFPGADIILRQIADGAPRRRVGLRPEGPAPVRAGARLFGHAGDNTPIGAITSGGFSVSTGIPIAMGYVPVAAAAPGTALCTELRGRLLTATVCALPFVPSHTKRD